MQKTRHHPHRTEEDISNPITRFIDTRNQKEAFHPLHVVMSAEAIWSTRVMADVQMKKGVEHKPKPIFNLWRNKSAFWVDLNDAL